MAACQELEKLNKKSLKTTNDLVHRENLVRNREKISQDLRELKDRMLKSNLAG